MNRSTADDVDDLATLSRRQESRLPAWQLVAYGIPDMGTKAMSYPALVALPAFYATYTDVTLEQIGVVLLAVRFIDAFTDPIIGYLSDHTKTRLGARKPWMLAGAVIAAVSAWFLFRPAETATVTDFAIWMFMLYLSWTMITVPYFTWASELSGDYVERSRITGYRGFFTELGKFVFIVIPFLPFITESEFGPETFDALSILLLVLLPVSIGVAVLGVPQGQRLGHNRINIGTSLKALVKNGPFAQLLLIFLFSGSAIGFILTTLILFVGGYFHSPDKAPLALLISSIVSIASYPVWIWICKRMEKHRAWALGLSIQLATLVISALLPPDPEAIWAYLTVYAIGSFAFTAHLIVPTSILADVIDYDIYKTGENRAGLYFSIFMFFYKLVFAIGSGVAFLLLAAFGFDADNPTASSGYSGLLLVYAWIPAVLLAVSVGLMTRFPITKRRQTVLRAWIERRNAQTQTLKEVISS